ncbi:DDE-type integrase/transposase/recombinase, partial [Escherichia coli]|uniref:DDE-type integrase/transposase/recombinase n=1 Tax=Escherichia coli TaxID=562 RepID=UPI0012FF8D7C
PKGRDILREAPEMKYVFIEKHQAEFSIKAMCRVLRVARSGWYGWLYLAVVIDLWSRAVIGWSMSPRMTAQLACDALQMALWRRK